MYHWREVSDMFNDRTNYLDVRKRKFERVLEKEHVEYLLSDATL